MSRIFGIGLPRTGTTTLTEALTTLGFPTAHYVRERDFEASLVQYVGLTDLPVPARYRELDRRFPGSRFILTVREFDAWLDSSRRWFGVRPANERRRAYRIEMFGVPEFDADAWARTHRRHMEDVEAWFRGRESDLLRIDIAAGEGWETLAPFLGVPIPALPFPHRNRNEEAPATGPAAAGPDPGATPAGWIAS